MTTILVTGGAGYIGSHTVIELINSGFKVVVVDNLVNASYDSISRVEFIVKKKVIFYEIDLRDSEKLSKVFDKYKIDAVIHFAGLKAVGESTKIPLEYFDNNVGGTISLLKVMKQHDVKSIVFSSSATVYGDATRFKDMIPIPEKCPTGPTNPYGHTKLVIEGIMRDIYASDNKWRIALLRYFNPIGAHQSGLIGEDPTGIPNNLLPFLAQVAIGRRQKLNVFGNDYDSHDGTPIRDYIHVVDLAKGHIAALSYLANLKPKEGICREWNLGTGKGSTVFDIYHSFCKAVGHDLPYEIVGRRSGDVLNLTACVIRANEELKWKAKLTIDDACRDLWNWTTKNPQGFATPHYHIADHLYGEQRIHDVIFKNFKFSVANVGATIVDVEINGHPVVCNFQRLSDYAAKENPYFGATIGRVANRLPGAKVVIEGRTYDIDANEGNNSLHGGSHGFNNKYFFGPVTSYDSKAEAVILKFVDFDSDGSNGYPGDLNTYVSYIVTPHSYKIEYESSLDPSSKSPVTVVNLTNHSYFHLSDESNINETDFKLYTNKCIDTDTSLLPTGTISTLTQPNVMEKFRLGSNAFDNCFVLSDDVESLDTRKLKVKKALEVSNSKSNLQLQVYTTEPAFQLYTGDEIAVKNYGKRSGFAVETSRFLGAATFEKWQRQVTLHKGELYGASTTYVFSSLDH